MRRLTIYSYISKLELAKHFITDVFIKNLEMKSLFFRFVIKEQGRCCLFPGVNFTNILCTAVMLADPKRSKRLTA